MNLSMIGESPIFSGTFLQELLEVLNDGKFTKIIDKPALDEKAIGKMNNLEKTLYTLCQWYRKRAKTLFHEDSEDKDILSQEAEFRKIKHRYEIAYAWLWSSIYEHFADQCEIPVTGIGIRSGFRVVQMFGKVKEPIYESKIIRYRIMG